MILTLLDIDLVVATTYDHFITGIIYLSYFVTYVTVTCDVTSYTLI